MSIHAISVYIDGGEDVLNARFETVKSGIDLDLAPQQSRIDLELSLSGDEVFLKDLE